MNQSPSINRCMILAAGKGERLRPITDHTPKPLVKAQGKPLIWHHMQALQAAGFTDLVVNVCHLKQQIIEFIDQQPNSFSSVLISDEGEEPLETGGGMLRALPLLQHQTYLAVNADIYTDFDFSGISPLAQDMLAHLVLVPNPSHNPKGDFSIENGYLTEANHGIGTHTYSGIGVFSPELFSDVAEYGEVFSVVPLIKAAIKEQAVTAQVHHGLWNDVGTPERLSGLNGGTICAN